MQPISRNQKYAPQFIQMSKPVKTPNKNANSLADEINDSTQALDIYECTDPTQWMLDNFTQYVPAEEWVEPASELSNTNIALA